MHGYSLFNRLKAIKGVALITVMLIVALAAIITTQMTARLQLQVQRTSNIHNNQQAYWYALGAEAFGKRVLITSFESEKEVTHLEQEWAQGEMTYPVEQGEITGEISDMHTCFNLNALKGESTKIAGESKTIPQKSFEDLVVALNIEGVGEFDAEYLTEALIDWLDSDSGISSAGGAEDNDYASREFPYLAANNYLASVSELRVIEHFTIPIINVLKDYVCVLPNTDLHQININTLDAEKPEILKALLDIPLSDATQLLNARDPEGYEEIDTFFALPEFTSLTLTDVDERKKQLVIDSEYFKLKTQASFNESYFSLISIMKIEENNEVRVISRTIGRE